MLKKKKATSTRSESKNPAKACLLAAYVVLFAIPNFP